VPQGIVAGENIKMMKGGEKCAREDDKRAFMEQTIWKASREA